MIMENIGLIEKIRRLPPDKVQEIEDFVDFLDQRTERNNGIARLESVSLDPKTRK